GATFKLQYAAKSGTCDTSFAGESFADVTAATPIAYYDNSTPVDGAAITANINDPTRPARPIVAQTYEEGNNFSNISSVAVGSTGLWDFSLVDNDGNTDAEYCFRVVRFNGAPLASYSVVPEVTTVSSGCGVIFSDDFEDGNAADWAHTWDAGGSWSVVSSGGSNVYRHNSGTYSQTQAPSFGADDYVYTGQFKVSTYGIHGFIFRYQNDSNFWRLVFEFNQVLLRGQVGGTWVNAAGQTVVNWVPTLGTTYNIMIKAEGSQLDAKWWAEGTPEPAAWMISANDSSLMTGYVGVSNQNFAEFDNLSVTTCLDVEPPSSIIVLTPNGGETLTYEDSYEITWSSYDTSGSLNIEYSTDNFSSDINTVVSGTADDGSYTWFVPNVDSATVRIRVTDAADVALTDSSDADFTIVVPVQQAAQSAYRLFENLDSTDVGPALAAQDTSGSLADNGDVFRLRLALDVEGDDLPAVNDPPAGAVSHWNFDEGSGAVARDSVSTSDGTVLDANWTSSSVSGMALDFNGSSSVVTVADDDSLDLTDEGTLETWFMVDNFLNYAGIVHKGQQTDFSDESYFLQFAGGGLGSNQQILAGGHNGSVNVYLTSNQLINPDVWYHVVYTWDGTGQRLYVNGSLDQSSAAVLNNRVTTGSLQIGSQLTGNYRFDGVIDEVSLYDRALGAAEIEDLYAKEKYKLQYATKVGECDTSFVGESYVDVTGSTPIAFFDNSPLDGLALTTNLNDPTRPGRDMVEQTYEDINGFGNITLVPPADSALWDFSLIDNDGDVSNSYCLRAVKTDGTLLDGYSVIPEISTIVDKTFRITEYYLAAGQFTGTSYNLTLDQDLMPDYFAIVQGSDGDGTTNNDRGPDENFAALTADPFGTGDLNVSAGTNILQLQRGNAVNQWQGVVTVVECLGDCSASGFRLLDVQNVTHNTTSTSGTDTSAAAWGSLDKVLLMGGFNGSGCRTSTTSAASHHVCYARLWPTGTNTVNWTRSSSGGTLSTAVSTVMVVEWGSEWTVQRALVTGTSGGNGINATSEYNTTAISPVTRDNTWVWGTGTTNDNGVGDSAEGAVPTLGNGVTLNATESTVALGLEYNDSKSFDIYVMTHPLLAVDYRFKSDSGSGLLTTDVTVDSATVGDRMAISYNGANGTNTAFPRSIFSARYLSDTFIRLERRRSGIDFPAWVQGINFGDIIQ
ncbi:MAG: LamG domain-containing protein, partial [Patescibacteria group bacterium]